MRKKFLRDPVICIAVALALLIMAFSVGFASSQTFGPQATLADGRDAAPSLAFASSTGTGIRYGGSDSLVIDAAGSNRMSITPTTATINRPVTHSCTTPFTGKLPSHNISIPPRT